MSDGNGHDTIDTLPVMVERMRSLSKEVDGLEVRVMEREESSDGIKSSFNQHRLELAAALGELKGEIRGGVSALKWALGIFGGVFAFVVASALAVLGLVLHR